MTARILSHSGNVIATDFRPHPAGDAAVEVQSEILFCDHLACLMRFRLLYGGKLIATQHITMLTPTD